VSRISKTELTKKLEEEIWNTTTKMGVFGCFEVTIGFATNKYGRVDYMTMDTKEIFRMYEIKVSKDDFHSKAKHTFMGHYNYYVMPESLYQEVKEEVSPHIGVYVSKGNWLACRKNPKRQVVTQPNLNILKDSMIRSLYREYEKNKDSQDISIMNDLKNKVQRLQNENRELNNANIKSIIAIRAMEKKFGVEWEDIVEGIYYPFKTGK
jgi:hypothetical protein